LSGGKPMAATAARRLPFLSERDVRHRLAAAQRLQLRLRSFIRSLSGGKPMADIAL
jgi:hypothetical protein